MGLRACACHKPTFGSGSVIQHPSGGFTAARSVLPSLSWACGIKLHPVAGAPATTPGTHNPGSRRRLPNRMEPCGELTALTSPIDGDPYFLDLISRETTR